jgi:hypothetical protein
MLWYSEHLFLSQKTSVLSRLIVDAPQQMCAGINTSLDILQHLHCYSLYMVACHRQAIVT